MYIIEEKLMEDVYNTHIVELRTKPGEEPRGYVLFDKEELIFTFPDGTQHKLSEGKSSTNKGLFDSKISARVYFTNRITKGKDVKIVKPTYDPASYVARKKGQYNG